MAPRSGWPALAECPEPLQGDLGVGGGLGFGLGEDGFGGGDNSATPPPVVATPAASASQPGGGELDQAAAGCACGSRRPPLGTTSAKCDAHPPVQMLSHVTVQPTWRIGALLLTDGERSTGGAAIPVVRGEGAGGAGWPQSHCGIRHGVRSAMPLRRQDVHTGRPTVTSLSDTRKSMVAGVDIGRWCGYGFSRSQKDSRAW